MKNFLVSRKRKIYLYVFVIFIILCYSISKMHSHPILLATTPIKIDGLYLTPPQEIVDFQLTDNHHQPFTKQNLQGHWTFLFFGFTDCGMVCPLTMAALRDMQRTLQQELPTNQLPQVVFVSVDPERDTVERLNSYVTSFNPTFKGVRGDEDQTEQLEKQLHIVAAKMQVEGGKKDQYTIDHSAEIMVINPEGKLQAFFSYPHKADQMIKDYKAILSAN